MTMIQAAEFFRRHCAEDHGANALYLPDWTAEDWAALLGQARGVALSANDVLIRRGQTEQSLFLVISGALEVSPAGADPSMGSLYREGPGGVIGEIAFFDGGRRSASVWAIEPSELMALTRQDLDVFSAYRPVRGVELLLGLSRVLAFRVRRSEQYRRADAF